MKLAVKEMRKAKNMTQQKLADKSGVSRATICLIERGSAHKDVKIGTLELLADALGCDITSFFMK